MLSIGILAADRLLRLARTADVVAAMTIEAALGTDAPFDERLQRLRPHPGQAVSAANLRTLLAGSPILASHRDSPHLVQDAYSLRCAPQVHGATLDALNYVEGVLQTEAGAVSDNPIVLADDDEVRSGGNFHGQPVALAADLMAIVATQLAGISERRTERLVNPALSGLPAFLAREGGLHSGLMLAHVTAAALASENKTLAHPASVDSIPTSAGKEDHVSMGPTAAWKAARVVQNAARVLAVELLAACEAIEFHRPTRSSAPLEAVHALVRVQVAAHGHDRPLGPEIEALAVLVRSGAVARAAEAACGALE
jgi:histidine ammonia-lyase